MDAQGVERLHVGEAFQEDDAVDEAIGVAHLFDRFLAPLLGEPVEPPIVEQPIMQPILIDGREFAAQPLVEIFNDFGIAFHGLLLVRTGGEALFSRNQ